MNKAILLAGARPNYMKVFPLWKSLREAGVFKPVLIHTGQHYDPSMSDDFFREFNMPPPDHFLGVGSASHGVQTGKIMIALEPLLAAEKPDWLVVVGDVNSTAAGALVAAKLRIRTAHVEAGLRSGDRTMPEEINRIVTDAISDLLLTSSRDADENLRREGVEPDKIRFVGNIMIDSLVEMLPRAAESSVLYDHQLTPKRYVCVTLHRPSNVDHPAALKPILDALSEIAETLPVVFPVHPRTRKMIEASGFKFQVPGFRLLNPLPYLDFLRLQSQAALVITDSGGVQEETTYLGIPCLTVRPNTERPITLSQGTNQLVAPQRAAIVQAAREKLSIVAQRAPEIELWDGHTAQRIAAALEARR